MGEVVVAKIAEAVGSELLAKAIVDLGSAVLLSEVSRAMRKKPRRQEIERDLSFPRSMLLKRFPYGEGQFAMGSPAPAHVVHSGAIYACHILSSRPAASIDQLVFDKRYVDFTGDIYDFSGDGAEMDHPQLTGAATCWVGRGDQTGPPDAIMGAVGDPTSEDELKYWPTDRWSGCTVLWGIYRKGDPASFQERWPAAPPEVGAIGDWSRVWDPRDGAQDPDDPATWTVSSNAWLCILDCLRHNPLARWPRDMLDIDSFSEAADDADADRALLGAATEPRWRLGGTVPFGDTELIDVIMPMLAATGGDIMVSGAGLRAIPAKSRSTVMTVTNWLKGEAMAFRVRQKSRDLPKAVQASWPQPEAKWEMQTMQPVPVPGQTWLGGDDRLEPLTLDLVPYPTQVQHLQQIRARRLGLGREMSFLAGPELRAEGVQAGDWVDVDFGSDYASRNGLYELVAMQNGFWIGDPEGGVAYRQPVTLRETSEDVTAWDPDTDQMPVYVPPPPSEIDLSLPPPAAVDLVAVMSGASGTIRVDVTPAPQHLLNSTVYTMEYRTTGGDWQVGSDIRVSQAFGDGDAGTVTSGNVITGVLPETEYEVRVRATVGNRASAFVSDTITTPVFEVIVDAGTGP